MNIDRREHLMSPMKRLFCFCIAVFFIATFLGCATLPTVPQNQPEQSYHPQIPATLKTIEEAKENLKFLLNKPVTIRYTHSPSAPSDAARDKLIQDIFKTKDVEQIVWKTGSAPWVVSWIDKKRIYVYSDKIDIPIYPLNYEEHLLGFKIEVRESNRSIIDLPNSTNLAFANEFKADVRKIADNLFFIQQNISTYTKEKEAIFQQKAAQYRSLKIKPPVSEEQRKFIVQANALNKQRDYNGAIDLYKKAISADPVSYPGAYFNMALLYAQMKQFNTAISNMRKYLVLEPQAKDARSAQDKIYEWEVMIQKQNYLK
jgi:tetratricopeptide (TPR) repeat protein